MSRAVLFCNGEINDYEYHRSLLKNDDYIIAVDGGGNHCRKLNIIPNLAIGDFDSLDPDVKISFSENKVESIPFPTDKDYIDMILGIEEALTRGYHEILLLGAMGGKRADMFLGNALALSCYNEHIVMKNEYSEIHFLREGSSLTLTAEAGDYLSLLPLSDTMVTGKSENLKYPLEDLMFRRGETRSISNEFLTDRGVVTIKKGEALVIVQKR